MGLLRDLQLEIEQRSLPSGGWPSGNGRRAGIETTCYALMALANDQERTRRKALDLLLSQQNPDGSWPAFDGDDPEGCWTTALAVITLRFAQSPAAPVEKALRWLISDRGREGHWFWKWKFRTVDRGVQFNPDKYGWPWFPGTVSWVVPTAFSLVALRQSLPCCRTEHVAERIRLGSEMLIDRACPNGGWNAGNGMVFGAALTAHVDTTAIALLALTKDVVQPAALQSLGWLRQASSQCSSAYSLAWSVLAFVAHQDHAAERCISRLHGVLSSSRRFPLNTETLSLAAVAIHAAEGNRSPFQVI